MIQENKKLRALNAKKKSSGDHKKNKKAAAVVAQSKFGKDEDLLRVSMKNLNLSCPPTIGDAMWEQSQNPSSSRKTDESDSDEHCNSAESTQKTIQRKLSMMRDTEVVRLLHKVKD